MTTHIDDQKPPPYAMIPLLELPDDEKEPTAPPSAQEHVAAQTLIKALQTSGFLLLSCPNYISSSIMTHAIQAARKRLVQPDEGVIDHPTDPKKYVMLNPKDEWQDCSKNLTESEQVLCEYSQKLSQVTTQLLRLLAIGLDMPNVDYFVQLHSEHNHTMRLIQYPPCSTSDGEKSTVGNRCKEHSDYGTLTLLTTDGVSGLEIFYTPDEEAQSDGVGGDWVSVPYIPGTLVVNIGTLLSEWSGGALLATLHRVTGPQSKYRHHRYRDSVSNQQQQKEAELKAWSEERTSIAFFVDPNEGISKQVQSSGTSSNTDNVDGMSVGEYITFRSGGVGWNRTGVQFSKGEEERMTS